MKIRIAFLDTWTESEAGWGQRQDGTSIHLTEEDYKKFVADYWSGMPEKVPHEYSRPDGIIREVVISDNLFKKIKKTKTGMKIWQSEFSELKKNNEILFKN